MLSGGAHAEQIFSKYLICGSCSDSQKAAAVRAHALTQPNGGYFYFVSDPDNYILKRYSVMVIDEPGTPKRARAFERSVSAETMELFLDATDGYHQGTFIELDEDGVYYLDAPPDLAGTSATDPQSKDAGDPRTPFRKRGMSWSRKAGSCRPDKVASTSAACMGSRSNPSRNVVGSSTADRPGRRWVGGKMARRASGRKARTPPR